MRKITRLLASAVAAATLAVPSVAAHAEYPAPMKPYLSGNI